MRAGQLTLSHPYRHDIEVSETINLDHFRESSTIIHLPELISDLGIILMTAGLVSLLFKRIGQPVVLGYLLAGVLVGPEISFLPTVHEKEAIKIWAEIGVIFLLFGLGLEFSFRKLMSVGRGASVTAMTEIVTMFGLGYLVGKAFGWNEMDSVFLGGILSISSTTIIIRAFDELGLKQRKFVGLVFGVLIVEDLVAILLLVVLSTIAVSQSFEGFQLLGSAARLGFFLTLWFLGGIFLLPWFLRRARPLMNEETSLIVSLGLCLLMVIIATQAGFSPALGAFIMGSILAETPDGERIEHILRPVRDLFAAVFFVSVGMLLDLGALREQWLAVVVITFVTIVGKAVSSTLGALAAGQRLKDSVRAGLSLAQIGEFSFIIATLGLTLKVTSGFLYPLAVAVSVITTFTTPYLIRSGDGVYKWLESRLPQALLSRLERSSSESPTDSESAIGELLNARLFLNTVVVIGVGLAVSKWFEPFVSEQIGAGRFSALAALSVAILLALPFLWAIVLASGRLRHNQIEQFSLDNISNLASRAAIALIARSLIAALLLGFLMSLFTSAALSLVLFAGLAVAIGFLGAKNFARIYEWLESRFMSHLNEKDLAKLREIRPKPKLAPWDAHLTEISVAPESDTVGRSLAELALRETIGVTIALIERGHRQILAPRRDTFLMANDRVFAIGTDEQLASLARLLATGRQSIEEDPRPYGLADIVLTSKSTWIGKTIRESGVREETEGLIVGLERDSVRLLNPDSLTILQTNDRLWIVGNLDLIDRSRSIV